MPSPFVACAPRRKRSSSLRPAPDAPRDAASKPEYTPAASQCPAINPARDTPVLVLGDGERLVESNAILLYLTDGTELLPDDRLQRAQVHRWMFYEQARIVRSIGGLRLRLARSPVDPSDEGVRRERRMCVAAAALVDQHLQQRKFLVGDRFSAADLCLYGYLHAAGDAGVDTSRLPALHAWLDRVRKRPRHVADLAALPDNVRAGHGRSIYDFVM